MSTLPTFTGPGFFAGEAPDGLTTVVSTPQPAEVRVYWRDPEDAEAEDVFVASTLSASNGTWRIDNLNPELQYVVRGRKAGFDDVTVVGATPSRTDVIAMEDHLQPTAEFDGLDGYVLMDSGLTPFTATVIDPLPFGLSAVMDGRKLLIEGTSDDEGIWQSKVRVTASNAVTVDVPVQVVIGLKAPVVTARYALDGDWTITLQLAGASTFAQELRVYRSTSPIDVEDLPEPVEVLDVNVVKWVDEDVEPGQTYRYLISAVFDGLESFGVEVVRKAVWSPADLQSAAGVWLDWNSDITSVSGAASEWVSRGVLGGVFKQSVAAARPQIIESALNGKRVLRFDGVNDALYVDSGAPLSLVRNVGSAWAFTVYKKRAADAAPKLRSIFVARAGSAGHRFSVLAGVTGTGGENRPSAGGRRLDADSFVSVRAADPVVDVWGMVAAKVSYTTRQLQLYVGGVLGAQTSSFQTAGQTSNTTSSHLMIGAYDTSSGADAGDVDVAAVLAGSDAISLADLQRLQGWAAHELALVSSLPADHPYKITPP